MPIDKSQIDAILASHPPRSLRSTLFNIAHAYACAADTSWGQMTETGNADFAAPSVMCQSFAVELLLKFFIVIDHPNAKTIDALKSTGAKLKCHKYSELYDQLIPATQAKIAQAFSSLAGKPTNPVEFRQALIAQGDDPFVYWRYIYETSGNSRFDRAAFNLITDALGKAAEAERKAAPNA